MIANGTGLAPFIGFAQELQRQGRKGTLVYGHRSQQDRIYNELLQEFEKEGCVTIIDCLSRVEGFPFKYVQDALPTLTSRLFSSGVYVCGYDVHNVLLKLKMEATGCSIEDAFAYWNERASSGEYCKDLWG
ncbi:hypothetical protein HDU91_001287 [Kappamyces sp. JEL0680]|nr:hypothetical protein HDU91_001287 [Kappamyces sp. JEL0680]